MPIHISRRTCFKWLLGCFGAKAFAQEAPVAFQAASSDSSKIAATVFAHDLWLGLSDQGHVLRLKLGPKQTEAPVRLCTVLANCSREGQPNTRSLDGGGAEFTTAWVHENTRDRCRLTERFLPMATSIRWEIEVLGSGAPWSTKIETQLAWLDGLSAQLWTAWGQPPQSEAEHWNDPLIFHKFSNIRLVYGGIARALDFKANETAANNGFSIPIVTVADLDREIALSVVQSPEDALLDVELQTTELGDAILRRSHHRISRSTPVRFAVDLVAHPPDWRAGLGWMAMRYPNFFQPANPRAYELDGCGAYSGYQGALEIDKLAHMAFSLNWNAHFDFPFQGLNFPLVGPNVEWKSWYQKTASIARMSEYDRKMKSQGFHVLEYFVITECGNYIQPTAPPRKAASNSELWRDPNDFIHYQIPDAVVREANGEIRYSNWFGNVAVDPAEPVWRDLFLQQARHMVEELPDSDGICIDRMDWLASYNPHRDDGTSWLDGKPARSILNSWKQALAKLGPILHDANKCIFVNCLTRRVDSLQHIDGIYTEFGYDPSVLNLAAVMGSQRPVILWTGDINNLRPDPDAYFQRNLHLGAFVTVPYPEADHTIAPDTWVNAQYLEYGRLFNAMRGKRWVLRAGAVSCVRSAAKVNLFEIPGGFVLPVTFGTEKQAEVLCALPPDIPVKNLAVQALHPGTIQWIDVPVSFESNGNLRLQVPLKRGCAMVRLVYARIEPDIAILKGSVAITIYNTVENSRVRYTVDGSEPTTSSAQYTGPIAVSRPTLIKAAVFVSEKQLGRTLFRQVYAI